jgi:8-hydroxy-5-deazaflavin:NADPH oxidoreductase
VEPNRQIALILLQLTRWRELLGRVGLAGLRVPGAGGDSRLRMVHWLDSMPVKRTVPCTRTAQGAGRGGCADKFEGDVVVSNSQGPASLAGLAAELSPEDRAGFDTVDIGGVDQTWKIGMGQPALVTRQNAEQLRANVARARR